MAFLLQKMGRIDISALGWPFLRRFLGASKAFHRERLLLPSLTNAGGKI